VPASPSDPQPARSRAAEVHLADTGSVTGWNPAASLSTNGMGSVRDFVPFFCTAEGENPNDDPTCSTIVAGAFDSAGGAPRSGLAETDRATGAARDWSPAPLGAVMAAACAPIGNRCDIAADRVLAVGGQFTAIGGIPRGRLAFFRAP
jgi:hypothetical protein